MSFSNGPRIVTDGLVLFLDAGDRNSLVSGSSSWIDLASLSASTISGTFNVDSSSYATPTLAINNNGTASNGTVNINTAQNMNTLASASNFTVMFAAKKNYYGIGGNSAGDSEILQGAFNGYDAGWRIGEVNTGATGSVFSAAQTYYIGLPDLSFNNTFIQDTVSNRMGIVAFSISPTAILSFINGKTGSVANPLSYVTGTSSPILSYTGAGQGSFNGLIGFLMIYNRALSTTEMLQNYNTLKGRFGLK
jgi:FlaG/FlaF family flagellin (archaellin)